MKIVFFGNSEFSVLPLQKMIEHFEVVGVVTAPDTFVGRGQKVPRSNPVKELAIKYHIPILQPDKLKNNDSFKENLIELKADLHIIVSYGKILPLDLIDIPKYKTINLHSSLLPAFRGAAPIQYALWHGLEKTGNTVQYITEAMDEGDIIRQNSVPIDKSDTYEELESKLALSGAELLEQAVLKIKQGLAIPRPQDHNAATYTKLIQKEDGAVFFSMSAEEIVNAYRAFKRTPGIYLPLEMGTVKIQDCSIADMPNGEKEGEVLAISPEGIIISCYEGTILLKSLQAPNKKPLSGRDFANGNRLKMGTILK